MKLDLGICFNKQVFPLFFFSHRCDCTYTKLWLKKSYFCCTEYLYIFWRWFIPCRIYIVDIFCGLYCCWCFWSQKGDNFRIRYMSWRWFIPPHLYSRHFQGFMLLSVFLVARKVTIFKQWIVFSLVLLTSPPPVNIFFPFSLISEFALVLRFGQNATFASQGSLLKALVIRAMMNVTLEATMKC